MAENSIEFDFTGGRFQDSAIRWVVYLIIACFVLPYGAELLYAFTNVPSLHHFFDWFMDTLRLDQSALHGEPWRFITYLFLHGGLIHVVFNLAALIGLYMIANAQFPRYVWILSFFLAGILGGLGEIVFNPDVPGVVGASAGVFGLWGAALAAAWRYTRLPFDERPQGNQENLQSLSKWLVINFIIGLAVPAIAKFAHVGGLLVGLVIGMIFPICGQPRLLATRAELFVVEDYKGMQTKNRATLLKGPIYFTWMKLLPTENFNPGRDALIAEYDFFKLNNDRSVRHVVLAGVPPEKYENLVEVATPLKIDVAVVPRA